MYSNSKLPTTSHFFILYREHSFWILKGAACTFLSEGSTGATPLSLTYWPSFSIPHTPLWRKASESSDAPNLGWYQLIQTSRGKARMDNRLLSIRIESHKHKINRVMSTWALSGPMTFNELIHQIFNECQWTIQKGFLFKELMFVGKECHSSIPLKFLKNVLLRPDSNVTSLEKLSSIPHAKGNFKPAQAEFCQLMNQRTKLRWFSTINTPPQTLQYISQLTREVPLEQNPTIISSLRPDLSLLEPPSLCKIKCCFPISWISKQHWQFV